MSYRSKDSMHWPINVDAMNKCFYHQSRSLLKIALIDINYLTLAVV